jgi:hypothetical protein
MKLFPSIRANLAERFIFNFRMQPEVMTRYLPVSWLTPQLVGEFAVASFCLLDLRDVMFEPLPPVYGLSSISCASRYAVVDNSKAAPRPVVFVTRRYTSSAFGSWLTGLGCSAPHPYAKADIIHNGAAVHLHVDGADPDASFSAITRSARFTGSRVFASAEAFAQFISEGASSYGLSVRGARLTKIDLKKEDTYYEPLEVVNIEGAMIQQWKADGAEFDSAFRTAGGRYEWTYRGLTA